TMHCLLLLLGLMALLNVAASRSVRHVGGGYSPVLPGGYYAQPPPPPHYPVYSPHSYGYGGYQAHPPPHGFGPAGNYYGVFQSFPGGGDPVQFDYNNRCSRNYIGIKPHPDQNQYYYVCQSNCVIFSKCRNHQSFDPTTGRCVQQPQRGPQQAPQPHRPRPSCQKEGRFPHPDDCKVYYRCDKNQTQPWLFACPEGTIFSPLVRKCVPGDQCPSTEISGSGSYIPQNCELKFPVCTEEGTFRSPTDCALYYTCRQQENGNYLQTRFKCPGSNSFDTERKLCRPRSEVDCYDYPPPLPYYPYYPPYPAAPLYEEDDYDTGAGAANKEQQEQTALKTGTFQENIVILPTTTTTEKPHYSYPSYSYDHSSYYGSKEPAADSLHVEEEKIVKPSVNVVILPSSTPATTSTQYQSTKYQYKRFTETPQPKDAAKGLHIANNIVILPTTETTTTTTAKPTAHTCPTIPTTTSTQKPTTIPNTSTVPTSTPKSTTTTQETSTVTTTTQKPTTTTVTTTPKSTTRETSTPKTSTSARTTEKVTTTTKKPITTTQKLETTTVKPTTITSTTHKPTTTPKSTTRETSTSSTTTKKPTTITTPAPTTTTQKPTKTTTPKSTTRETSTPKTSTSSSSTVPTSTTKSTTTEETSTVTTSTKKPTTITTPVTTTTTQKPTTTTPKSTTRETSTPKTSTSSSSTPKSTTSETSTPKTSTSSRTTEKATTTTEKPKTTTQKLETTPKTSTVTSTTPEPKTTTRKPTTVTISTQKPTSTTPWLTTESTRTTETTTVLITTERPTTTTPRTSTVTISTQGPTTTEKSTSVTATSTVTTSPAPEHNSTATTDLTTRPHCPDPDTTSDTNTQPACTPTQHLQSLQVKEQQSSVQSPNHHTHNDTAITGSGGPLGKRVELQQPLRANSLNSREESLDYMDDGPSFSAESKAEAGRATTAKVPTMSTLAAAHILRKLFHVISTTTPASRERASSQRPPGVTIAQMARHNLATSKPFIAHSLRLSIQQLASTQKREIQSQILPVAAKKESEDSEYYDTSEQQYADDEDNQVLERREKNMAMASSTTMAAVLPAVQESTTTTEQHETSSRASPTRRMSTSTPQPLERTTMMTDSEYSDSDYVNDEAENEIPGGVKSLEARKSMLLSLLKERLQPLPLAMAARKMEPSSSTSPGTSTTFKTSFSTSSSTSTSTSSPLTSTTTRLPSKPMSTLSSGKKGHQSSEYYDDDDDYMEDEPASGLANQSRDILAKKPPTVTAKRHIVVLPQSQLQPQPQIQKVAPVPVSIPFSVVQNETSSAKSQELGEDSPQLPTASFLRQSSAEVDGGKSQSQSQSQRNSLADEASRRLSFLGRILRITSKATTVKPQTITTHITKSTKIPKTLSTASFTASTTESFTTTAPESSTKGEPTRVPRSFMTKLLQNAGKAHDWRVTKLKTVTPTGTPTKLPPLPPPPPSVRQAVLSVNSRPWLLAARNQTVHITPIATATVTSTLNPVSQFNSSNILRPPLVSNPEDYSTEKVPQLIVKVYEPIDLKIVFCPKSCDQDHDHKYDPADNHKNITSCTGGNCEEEEIHKHVDIQWKPLELSDIASFRNAV
ncbi:hypothetical protein KR032_005321, partial [Drosophila birchii]